MSMVWQLDAGCAPPLMNREVLDQQGGLVAVVDLLDTQTPTYGESAARYSASFPRRWRVGRHVPMRQLSPDLTTEEVERLAGWGTNPGS
jgi:hypothetical protein